MLDLLSKKRQLAFLGIIIVINLGTFLHVHPLAQNLSDLGNSLGYRFYLILWGISASLYFYMYTVVLIKKSSYPYRLGKYLLALACFFMVLSVCIPYLPNTFPTLSKWHTRIAMGGTVLYVLVVFHILTECMKANIPLFHKYFYPYCYLVLFDVLLYLLNGGVSTLLETTFTIGMCTYLYVVTQDNTV